MSSAVEFWDDYEVLVVETPENIELRLPLAGFGPRFLALVIDTLLQGVVTLVVVVLLLVMAAAVNPVSGDAAMQFYIILVVVAGLVANFGYYMIFELIWNGQTPGKRVTGIRVVRRGGLPLTAREVLLRNLVRIVDSLPTNYLIGIVSFFASKNQQRLGDLVADTAVIREFSQQRPYDWVGNVASIDVNQSALSPQMSYIIGSYLGRSLQLSIEQRLTLTTRIITALGYDPQPLALTERDQYLASVLNWAAGESR